MIRTFPYPVLLCSTPKSYFDIFLNANSPSKRNFKKNYYSHGVLFCTKKNARWKSYRKMQLRVSVIVTHFLNFPLGHKFFEMRSNVFSIRVRSLGEQQNAVFSMDMVFFSLEIPQTLKDIFFYSNQNHFFSLMLKDKHIFKASFTCIFQEKMR